MAKLMTYIFFPLLASISILSLSHRSHASSAALPQAEISHGDSPVVLIGIGESTRIAVAPGAKVHVSDGGIVRSRVIGNEIVMTGRKIGRTTLRFLTTPKKGHEFEHKVDKTVLVVERKVVSIARKFQMEIKRMRGLKLDLTLLPQISVGGELLRLDDWETLVSLARAAKAPWHLEARVLKTIQPNLRRRLEQELTRLAWPGHLLSIDAEGLVLTSGTESGKLSAEQRNAIGALGLRLSVSPGLTELEPMVRTQIVLAEIRRSHLRKIGLRWPTSVEASFGGGLPQLQIPTEPLMVALEALEDDGEGRILAMPNLLCRSGGEAKFLAGGEIPIKIATVRTSQVEWKRYGIQLHVQPKADRMERINLQLSTEVSTLDGASAADGVPGILTNRIETQFNLQGSETIVLSGLIKREDSKIASGLPFLRSLPILGNLFESQDFRKNLTELIVFVTPKVISPDFKSNLGTSNFAMETSVE
jgi:pilus assembly protein CpaC